MKQTILSKLAMLACLGVLHILSVDFSHAQDNSSDSKGGGPVPVNIPTDAEYMGAKLSSAYKTTFYHNGQVKLATLAKNANYELNEFTFAADTEISFHRDGTVRSGYLKDEVTINDLTFQAGKKIAFHTNGRISDGHVKKGGVPNGKNLVLPVNMSLRFDEHGYVSSLESLNVGNVLGVTSVSTIFVRFDHKSDEYKLIKGVAGVAQLVAVLPTKYDKNGELSGVVPVVAPSGSGYTFDKNELTPQSNPVDRWFVPSSAGPISINGYDFGFQPVLHIRNRTLVGVYVRKAITLDGHKFPKDFTVRFDRNGKVVKP